MNWEPAENSKTEPKGVMSADTFLQELKLGPCGAPGHEGPSVPQDSEILGYSRQSSSDRKTPLQAAHLTEQRPKSLIISSESFYLQRQCQEHRRQSSHLTLAGRCTGSPIHSKGNLSTAISTRRFTELKSSHFVPKERTET